MIIPNLPDVVNIIRNPISNPSGERNADGSPATSFYPYPGRYFEVGVTMNF